MTLTPGGFWSREACLSELDPGSEIAAYSSAAIFNVVKANMSVGRAGGGRAGGEVTEAVQAPEGGKATLWLLADTPTFPPLSPQKNLIIHSVSHLSSSFGLTDAVSGS